ncbi:MAG: hypothetical protein GAK30_03349 [Paracidovorax wautersii]|uniref:BrnA antitoxin of type II toxin-antitoxin system n=1 Tax=Paracidovorax wautersii TaxID=1177982 RepID=A0A7V8FLA5_9BURK|nr:MAG: hypothetical protein GAK30_03349 [Paracidovorax wautersii]
MNAKSKNLKPIWIDPDDAPEVSDDWIAEADVCEGIKSSHCATLYKQRNTWKSDTMSEATFTFRVDETLKTAFATAAKARDRTGAQLLRDFMREFVQQQQELADHDAWLRQQVQAGLDSANAGHLLPAAEVEAKFAARRAATRRRLETPE